MTCAFNYRRFESCGARVSSTKHIIKNTTYDSRCDTSPKVKVSQKNHSKADQSSGHEKKTFPKISYLDALQLLQSARSEAS